MTQDTQNNDFFIRCLCLPLCDKDRRKMRTTAGILSVSVAHAHVMTSGLPVVISSFPSCRSRPKYMPTSINQATRQCKRKQTAFDRNFVRYIAQPERPSPEIISGYRRRTFPAPRIRVARITAALLIALSSICASFSFCNWNPGSRNIEPADEIASFLHGIVVL
jgi:hypothetical protein